MAKVSFIYTPNRTAKDGLANLKSYSRNVLLSDDPSRSVLGVAKPTFTIITTCHNTTLAHKVHFSMQAKRTLLTSGELKRKVRIMAALRSAGRGCS